MTAKRKSSSLNDSTKQPAKAAVKVPSKTAARAAKQTLGERIAALGKYKWDFEAMKRA